MNWKWVVIIRQNKCSFAMLLCVDCIEIHRQQFKSEFWRQITEYTIFGGFIFNFHVKWPYRLKYDMSLVSLVYRTSEKINNAHFFFWINKQRTCYKHLWLVPESNIVIQIYNGAVGWRWKKHNVNVIREIFYPS